jgi:hypothetical protein
MAKLMLIGRTAEIELTTDPEDGQIIATCENHVMPGVGRIRCDWTERYDDLNDASEYAADHADTGRN